MDLWAYQRGVTLDLSRPGEPTDNAFIEAFNSKLRSECLNAHWFLSLQDACEKLEAWRRHYNEERPHSAIGNIPPIMLENSAGATSPPELGKAGNSSCEWSSFQGAEHDEENERRKNSWVKHRTDERTPCRNGSDR